MKKKTVKEIKMHNFLVCACKSQDFAQSQKKIARLHDRETMTYKNSDIVFYYICCTIEKKNIIILIYI